MGSSHTKSAPISVIDWHVKVLHWRHNDVQEKVKCHIFIIATILLIKIIQFAKFIF